MSDEERWRSIEDVRAEAIVCCRCDLCRGRTHVVFGSGPVPAAVMIVGEAPGRQEDAQAKPFVGRAGGLLDKLLKEAGIGRSDVWMTNIVRCRPTDRGNGALRDRAPRRDEIGACEMWMNAEYGFVAPQAILCLCTVASQTLISRGFRISEGRGRWHEGRFPVPVTSTYHPAYALRVSEKERGRVRAQMLADLRMAAASILSRQ